MHPWPVTLVYISVCGMRVSLVALMCSGTPVHFSVAGACHFLHSRPVTLVYISVCARRVSLLAPMASSTRVHLIVWQARATSCPHGQWHSCAFQCAACACHFLRSWAVALLYISVCGRRVPLLAPTASDTRVHFSVRQARATSCTHGQ